METLIQWAISPHFAGRGKGSTSMLSSETALQSLFACCHLLATNYIMHYHGTKHTI